MTRKILSLLMLTLLPAACARPMAELEIDQAWVRLPPPGATMTAGYFALHNPTDTALRLRAAGTQDFEQVSLHEMRVVDGMMRMRALEWLEVPAGGRIELAPGGHHLMLHGSRRELAAGQRVGVTLRLEWADGRSEERPLELAVRP